MLLIGPPGSGKTHRVLAEFEAALAAVGLAHVKLVTPTASMAEHLQHDLARRGRVVQPESILPFSAYVAGLTPNCIEATATVEALLIEQSIEAVQAREFEAVKAYPGFHAKLLDTIEEFGSAGAADPAHLKRRWKGNAAPLAEALWRVMEIFRKKIREAGLVSRSERILLAAAEARKRKPGVVLLDGFFNFTAAEIELVRALAETAEKLVVTLPEDAAGPSRDALLAMGLIEERLQPIQQPRPQAAVVCAPSPEREIEHTAGTILEDRERTGRRFLDYGILLRAPDQYTSIIASVFERFGIPFRLRQPQALRVHGCPQFLAGLLRVAAGGFEGAETLAVMKLAGSGIAFSRQMDRYEFRLREKLPGAGLAFLRLHAQGLRRIEEWLQGLEEICGWDRETLAPAKWAARCEDLAQKWSRQPKVEDGIGHGAALELRTIAAALRGWDAAAAEAAEALHISGLKQADLNQYLRTLEKALQLTSLRTPDHRRNVVQVLSIYEARQWRLPVVFVCGLVEQQFPRYHPQNLFFADSDRARLNAGGLRLRTSKDHDAEERFLFDLATTRATEQLHLTYPARDDSGADTLKSFFLEGLTPQTGTAMLARTKEPAPPWPAAAGQLRHPDLIEKLAEAHERVSPSSLETFLQCPFQFFAEKTLRLEQPPARPEERINYLLKGNIIHHTIAEWSRQGGPAGGEPIEAVFERNFQQECEEQGIPLNFQAEAMRLQLISDLRNFAAREQATGAPSGFQPGEPESSFECTLMENSDRPFRITGRIDRHEISASGAVLVTDYKYSPPARIKGLIEQHEGVEKLQGSLYLLGLEKQRGMIPAGLVFYGLREEIRRSGWFVRDLAPADAELTELEAGQLREMIDKAAARAADVVGEIRSGCVKVAPTDRQVCQRYCAYRQVCRVVL